VLVELAHACTRDVTFWVTVPSAHDEEKPFVAVVDAYFEPNAGMFVHRVDEFVVEVDHTSHPLAVHDQEWNSYIFSVAAVIFFPNTGVTVTFMNDRYFAAPEL
jgi:hypothetical protein